MKPADIDIAIEKINHDKRMYLQRLLIGTSHYPNCHLCKEPMEMTDWLDYKSQQRRVLFICQTQNCPAYDNLPETKLLREIFG